MQGAIPEDRGDGPMINQPMEDGISPRHLTYADPDDTDGVTSADDDRTCTVMERQDDSYNGGYDSEDGADVDSAAHVQDEDLGDRCLDSDGEVDREIDNVRVGDPNAHADDTVRHVICFEGKPNVFTTAQGDKRKEMLLREVSKCVEEAKISLGIDDIDSATEDDLITALIEQHIFVRFIGLATKMAKLKLGEVTHNQGESFDITKAMVMAYFGVQLLMEKGDSVSGWFEEHGDDQGVCITYAQYRFDFLYAYVWQICVICRARLLCVCVIYIYIYICVYAHTYVELTINS